MKELTYFSVRLQNLITWRDSLADILKSCKQLHTLKIRESNEDEYCINILKELIRSIKSNPRSSPFTLIISIKDPDPLKVKTVVKIKDMISKSGLDSNTLKIQINYVQDKDWNQLIPQFGKV